MHKKVQTFLMKMAQKIQKKNADNVQRKYHKKCKKCLQIFQHKMHTEIAHKTANLKESTHTILHSGGGQESKASQSF